MANEEHLAILKQGVEVWNKWRKENPHVLRNLYGADLVEARLTKANLSGTDLRDADLRHAELSGASFRLANLGGARLNTAVLILADLSGAYLGAADLSGAQLNIANLSQASLIGAVISNADLGRANLSGAVVTQVVYDRALMVGKYHGICGVESSVGNAVFKREALDQAYIDELKVNSRGSWRKHLFWAWGFFTDYGRSMGRIAGWALFLALSFALLYTTHPSWINYGPRSHNLIGFTPVYFSFVTYTTLGFGDVTANCLAGEICVTIEVVLGYVTLGLLLSVLANTVARRS